MGLFDQEIHNSTDNIFDMNHDGKLDSGEQYYEYQVFNEVTKDSENEKNHKNNSIPSSSNSEDTLHQIFIFFGCIVVFFIILAVCAGHI